MERPTSEKESEWLEYVAEMADAVSRYCDVPALEKQIGWLCVRLSAVRAVSGLSVIAGFVLSILSLIGFVGATAHAFDAAHSALPLIFVIASLALLVTGIRGRDIYTWYRKRKLAKSPEGRRYDIRNSDAFCVLVADAEMGSLEIAEILSASGSGKMSPSSQLPVQILGKRDWNDPFLPARFQLTDSNNWLCRLADTGRSRYLVLAKNEEAARPTLPENAQSDHEDAVWYRYRLWNLNKNAVLGAFDRSVIYADDPAMRLRMRIAFEELVGWVAEFRKLQKRRDRGSGAVASKIDYYSTRANAERRVQHKRVKAAEDLATMATLDVKDQVRFNRLIESDRNGKRDSIVQRVASGKYPSILDHIEPLIFKSEKFESRYLEN
jgi:hypothetical protein